MCGDCRRCLIYVQWGAVLKPNVHHQNSLCKHHLQSVETKEKAIARQSKPYQARVTQCQCNNEHITAQMRRPSRQRTWSTTSQNSKTHKVEKSCPARANETAFMRRAHEPKIAPSPGAHPGYAVGRHTRIKLDVPCEKYRPNRLR